MKPMLGVGTPLMHGPSAAAVPGLQGFFDAALSAGHQWYWRADFFRDAHRRGDRAHAEWGPRMPSGQSTMHLYPIDGAVHDVAAGDTPFSYRDVTLRRGDRRRRPRPGQRGGHHLLDERLLGGDCTPTRPAAPTSTS